MYHFRHLLFQCKESHYAMCNWLSSISLSCSSARTAFGSTFYQLNCLWHGKTNLLTENPHFNSSSQSTHLPSELMIMRPVLCTGHCFSHAVITCVTICELRSPDACDSLISWSSLQEYCKKGKKACPSTTGESKSSNVTAVG